jgi:ribonuclease Z
MHHLFEPGLVHDPCGDPGLYVDFPDERRALLFDLGDIAALPPRKLMRLSHVFVTHTHMDHFAGFDQLLRVVLGRKGRIGLLGGPGFVGQVEHKLRAYTWNVVHRYAVPLLLEVREVHPTGYGLRACFCSCSGFAREAGERSDWDGDVLHDEPLIRVRGRFVDHEMPCLAFALEEKARVRVARDRLDGLGVTPGPWLRVLKEAVLSGAPEDTPIELRWRDRGGAHCMTRCLGELRQVVLDVAPGRRIGYVTDMRFTAENLQAILPLLAGVDELYIESVFLQADLSHARRKNHLTARDAGFIARQAGARALVPFHFSSRYRERAAEVRAEALAAWSGDA